MFVGPFEVLHGYPPRSCLSRDHSRTLTLPSSSRLPSWIDARFCLEESLVVPAPAQDLEAFKADMTSMLSDMLQFSLSKFASQFNPSSGGQGDSVPTQTVASVPTTDVASDRENIPPGPEDQSKGQIVDSKGDPGEAGIPRLDNLKMTEEEERDFDAFSLASVTVPKRPWRAQEDSNVSKPQPQNISHSRQARPVIPQAVAKAQSVKSAQSDQRSVQSCHSSP